MNIYVELGALLTISTSFGELYIFQGLTGKSPEFAPHTMKDVTVKQPNLKPT